MVVVFPEPLIPVTENKTTLFGEPSFEDPNHIWIRSDFL